MSKTKEISEVSLDRKQRLKDLMKRQLTANDMLNLKKVVETFGADNLILKEVVLEWANEGIQRMKAITPTSKTHERFIKMFKGICVDICFEKHPDSIFFFMGTPTKPEFWFELENSTFWSDHIRVWSVFEEEYSMKYIDIRGITRPLVEEAFNIKVDASLGRSNVISRSIEKTFRLKSR